MAGAIDLFDIQLVSGSAELRPGDLVVGSVLVRIRNDSTILTSLQVYFVGDGKTAWIAKRSDKIFETRENYLSRTIDLNDAMAHFQPGLHSIPFNFTLPTQLPPSFEGEFGFIRYSCSAVLTYSVEQTSCMSGQQSFELNCEKLLTVVNNQFLDCMRPHANMPTTKEDRLEAIGCFGRLGAINLRFSIPRSNYHVGEVIFADVLIKNQSRQKIKSVLLCLIQESHFEAFSVYESIGGSKDVLRVMESAQFSKKILALEEVKWQAELPINSNPPTFSSKLISVKYFLRLTVMHTEMCIPVTIDWLASNMTQQSCCSSAV